jgi:NAD+ synthase (glutamine-hydrolysing)
MKCKLALAQINTVLGNVQKNLEKHLTLVDQAAREGADLLIFPELSLTGYLLLDMVPQVSIHPNEKDPVFSKLLEASQKLDLVVGFVQEDERNRFYIASGYLSGGKVVHVHQKIYLPTYGLFDEGRFFAWGDSVRAFDTRFGRFGMLVCEDFWHASLPYLLWQDGADVLIFTSSSPGRGLSNDTQEDSARWVDHINRAYASSFTTFVAHTNRVGYEDGLHFWGGAMVYDPNGNVISRAPQYEETISYCEIDLNQLHRTRTRLPLLRDERTALVQRELSRILTQDKRPSGR